MINGEYILVEAPDEYPGKKYRGMYAYEHHLVYWRNTGHILQPGEELHHINGKKQKNYFENLELKTKIAHAKEHSRYKLTKLVKLRCPSCNKIFFRRYGMTHLINKKAKVTCCSRQCSGRWPSIKRNNKTLAKFRESNNVVKVFTTSVYYSKFLLAGSSAMAVKRVTVNHEDVGSTPTPPATFILEVMYEKRNKGSCNTQWIRIVKTNGRSCSGHD